MQVIRALEECPVSGEGCAITIGVYDGLHLGHLSVIERTRTEAARVGAKTAVVTFDRHPASLLRPESAPKLLTNLDQKLEHIEAAGVDYVYVVTFDETRSQETAEDFARQVMIDCLHARVIVVGNDFHFGKDRGGNVELLQRLGVVHGFETIGIELLDAGEAPVSSTRIRQAVAAGDMEVASAMLGRPHEVRGEVRGGDKRGRTIGFPTANVAIPDTVAIPADAVYAGWYHRPNGDRHMTAINLGRRPTFYEDARESLLEAHLLDFAGDLYGEAARVQFVKRLRGEVKFDGLEQLKAQLVRDVEDARTVLSAQGCAD